MNYGDNIETQYEQLAKSHTALKYKYKKLERLALKACNDAIKVMKHMDVYDSYTDGCGETEHSCEFTKLKKEISEL